jgi:hypothetical protein
MHGHQKKALALVVIGMVLAGSAVVQRIAESLPVAGISEAKMPRIERRFARFVANNRIVGSEVWKQLLPQVLPYWQGKAVQLVLDCTPCADQATMVYLGWLVHSRVLPLLWRVMPLQEEWEQEHWKLVGEMCIWPAVSVRSAPSAASVAHPWSSCAALAIGITCCASAKSIRCAASWVSASVAGRPVGSWFTEPHSSGSLACCAGRRRRSTRI